MRYKVGLLLTGVFTVTGCGSGNEAAQPTTRRPVTVFSLSVVNPSRDDLLAGSVSPWKTEKLGFQVAGRVATVLEPGVDIEGRALDEHMRVISQGTVIATLERERFDIQLASATSQHETALAQARAKETELTHVVPAEVRVADASAVLAEQDLKRSDFLLARKVISQGEYDKTKAAFDSARAKLDQAKAHEQVTAAEVDSYKAKVKEAAEAVRQAQQDLADTRLISPFRGQIAAVYEIAGAYVQAGHPVAQVQLMDPIKVEVAVSAATDARLNYNDTVRVLLPDSNRAVDGMVYEKDTVADPATRTFKITLLVRNDRLVIGPPDLTPNSPRVRSLWRLFTEKLDGTPPYFVNVESLHQEGDQFFVWKIDGADASRKGVMNRRLTLRKVRVVPGEKRIPFLQVAVLRELKDIGGLDPRLNLLAGAIVDGQDKPLDKAEAVSLKDVTTVAYVREHWRLRPGDIVRVALPGESYQPGWYIPANAITDRAGRKFVFAVEGNGESEKTRAVEVSVGDAVGTLRRVSAKGDKALTAGMRIVLGGAMFVTDGEAVRVVEAESSR